MVEEIIDKCGNQRKKYHISSPREKNSLNALCVVRVVDFNDIHFPNW